MAFWATDNNQKFGFVIFVALVVFCLVMLSWWIYFQVTHGKQLYQLQAEALNNKIESLTNEINSDFRRLSDLAEYIKAEAGPRDKLKDCMVNLSNDDAMLGYALYYDEKIIFGQSDDRFMYKVDENLIIYFNEAYIISKINEKNDSITYKYDPISNPDAKQWVSQEMFTISPEVIDEINEESYRKTVMFISEGAFFLFILLFGAFLMYRTLQKSEELKNRQVNFIQAVTHEFRTPLTSIKLYLETLKTGKIDSEKSVDIYTRMLDDCDRLDGLIDNVLQAGKYGKEKFEFKLTKSNLSADVKTYLRGMEQFVDRQNGKIIESIEDDIYVNIDFQAIGRAFRALLDNAVKYSPLDRREISVDLAKDGKQAVLSIADKGLGIPTEELGKLFKRFYRIEGAESRQVKGTGLGLYIVKQIIDGHNGTIGVYSDGANKGSKFVIKLPIAKE